MAWEGVRGGRAYQHCGWPSGILRLAAAWGGGSIYTSPVGGHKEGRGGGLRAAAWPLAHRPPRGAAAVAPVDVIESCPSPHGGWGLVGSASLAVAVAVLVASR